MCLGISYDLLYIIHNTEHFDQYLASSQFTKDHFH